ncbi:MAG: hypothetical protein ACXACD_22255 [Candidatus Thorarchaeota archaeon]|jgi:hypothetical protein
MPKWLHDKLVKQAAKKKVRDKDAYVYGTLAKHKKKKAGGWGKGCTNA